MPSDSLQLEFLDERTGELLARKWARGLGAADWGLRGVAVRLANPDAPVGGSAPAGDFRAAKVNLAYALALQLHLSRGKIESSFADPFWAGIAPGAELDAFLAEDRDAMLSTVTAFWEAVTQRLNAAATQADLAACRQYVVEHFAMGVFQNIEGVRPWISKSPG